MARTYTQKKRAEQQAETRARIAEAALELHSTIGPARTTISMIAEKAGVQRHTLYAHFPEERDILMACSGLAAERDPMPDPAPWAQIKDRNMRLRTALGELYDYFARNEKLVANVLRDAETHALLREIGQIRRGPRLAAYMETLGQGMTAQQRGVLQLALSFHAWRTLVRQSGLDHDAAIRVMICAIACAA